MKKQDIAALAFKISGIYVFMEFIKSLTNLMITINAIRMNQNLFQLDQPSSYLTTQYQSMMSIIKPTIITVIFLFAAGVGLWFYSPSLGKKIFPEDEESVIGPKDYESMQVTAFSVVGLILFVKGLPQLLQFMATAQLMGSIAFSSMPLKYYVYSNAASIFNILAGILLLFKSKVIVAGLWSREKKSEE